MKNYNENLAIDTNKIDIDFAITILNAYDGLSTILLHIWILERIFELIQWRNTEIIILKDIVQNSILHCTIANENPTAIVYDTNTGETIPWPFIYKKKYIEHTSSLLPLLEDLNKRILVLIDRK